MPRGAPGLSRHRIIAAAAELAKERGLAALTMRDLARALNVGTMSLCYHVPDRAALEDGLTELVWSEVELPSGEAADEWRQRVGAIAASWRRVMLDNHALLPLLLTRRSTGPCGLAPVEALLCAFGDAGYDATDSVRCFRLVTAFVVGFVEAEVARSLRDPVATAAAIARDTRARYPHLLAAVRAAAKMNPDDEFAFGLAHILDSLEASRERP